MLMSIIRPTSYHANLQALKTDFYHFREKQDEVAAEMIAKSIRKLLRRVKPNINHRRTESENNSSDRASSADLDHRLFHSDSSLVSTGSKKSTASIFTSNNSLITDGNKISIRPKNQSVEVLLPDDMLNRLARDIVRMAEGESDGIRGCQLSLTIKGEDSFYKAGKINCDGVITPSCLLNVQLASMSSSNLQASGSQMLLNRLLGVSFIQIYIKPGYMIEKKRILL